MNMQYREKKHCLSINILSQHIHPNYVRVHFRFIIFSSSFKLDTVVIYAKINTLRVLFINFFLSGSLRSRFSFYAANLKFVAANFFSFVPQTDRGFFSCFETLNQSKICLIFLINYSFFMMRIEHQVRQFGVLWWAFDKNVCKIRKKLISHTLQICIELHWFPIQITTCMRVASCVFGCVYGGIYVLLIWHTIINLWTL